MIRNYLLIAFRYLLKNRLYAFLNIIGLSIGIAACLIIYSYVQHEGSYDNFHPETDRTYKLNWIMDMEGEQKKIAVTPAAVLPDLTEAVPEIESGLRIYAPTVFSSQIVQHEDKIFNENRIYFADSNFLQFLNFPLLAGDPSKALNGPGKILITPAIAEKYFAGSDPIGKIIQIKGFGDQMVSGIITAAPSNSVFRYDFVGSFSSLKTSDTWGSANYYTLVRLRKDAEPENFLENAEKVMAERLPKDVFGNAGIAFSMIPLDKIHFSTDYEFEIGPVTEKVYLRIFSAVAIFILLIACINYINLATARSADRTHEIGLRKSLGAGRRQIFGQFMSEAFLIALFALVLALMLTKLTIPWIETVLGQVLLLEFAHWDFLILIIAIFIGVGFISGIYPSVFLASLLPKAAMKGGKGLVFGKGNLRKSLVVFQFVLSIVLISVTLVVYLQMQYIREKNLGFAGEQVVYSALSSRNFKINRFETLKTELEKNHAIRSVTYCSALPGRNSGGQMCRSDQMAKDQQIMAWEWQVEKDFISTLGLELVSGRDFTEAMVKDGTRRYCVLNEKAARDLGLEPGKEAGRTVYINENPIECIGVLKNFHFSSLRQDFEPLLLKLSPDWITYLAIRFDGKDPYPVLESVKETWKKVLPENPLELVYLDQDFSRLIQAEERTGRMLTFFAANAILIACLGLLGLISFSTVKRAREIGIRKVLGSSEAAIVLLLVRESFLLILLAALIALPGVFYLVENWLQMFAFRIDTPYFIFPAGVLFALILMMTAIGYHAFRAARSNPVHMLRGE